MPSATREGGVLRRERSQVLRLFVMVVALMAGLAIALGAMLSAAQAAPVGKLTQFKVPTDNSQPRDITVGSDGNLWFTEGNEVFTPGPDPDGGGTFHRNVGRITPTGEITEFRIEDGIGPTQCFCLLNDIVQGPGDVLYFTTNNPGLGRITTDGKILPFVAPDNSAANGSGIAAHGDDIWYADFNNDSLWRYDTSGPDTGFTQFPVPEPSDVAVDEAGIVWFAATSDQAIGRLDPATGNPTLTPTVNLVPRGITVAADGDVWFSARFVPQGVGELDTDEIDPDTNDIREFPLTDNPGPQDIAASPNGSVWFTQTTEGNIARITDAGVVTEGKVVKNSEPFGITVAPNGAPWYAMLEANKIARLTPN
jgi:virginiamycin B lyase